MIKFGTGGWRAIIGDDFTKANIQMLAQGVANKMKSEGVADKGIVIGYDRRFLSKEAMQWSAMVFAAAGIKTYLINRSVPTPLVMFYVMKHEFPYGMMITASHNPSLYNGIKVFTEGGRDADEIQTKDVEDYISDIKAEEVCAVTYEEGLASGYIEEIYPMNEYLDSIIASMNMDAIREAGMKVAFDPMYGVSEGALKTILMTARCDVYAIHEEHDTLFGGRLPAPSESLLQTLRNTVLDKKCDIGIASDGDGDRLGVIDDKGNFLHPNDILVLLYYYLVKYKGWHGPVVRNLATTHMLDKVAEQFGETCYEVPVGFKYISAKMTETGAIIGGESSGGLTVRGHISGKDGVYAATLLIEMVAVIGKPLSEIMADIHKECGRIYMEERDYKFSAEKKEEMLKILMEDKQLPELPAEVDHVSYPDGSKVYFKNGGWVIARFSGTEPLLRIFCEMPTSKEAKEICEIYEEFLGL